MLQLSKTVLPGLSDQAVFESGLPIIAQGCQHSLHAQRSRLEKDGLSFSLHDEELVGSPGPGSMKATGNRSQTRCFKYKLQIHTSDFRLQNMSEIKTECPDCGTSLKLHSDDAGKPIKCPKCESRFITEVDDLPEEQVVASSNDSLPLNPAPVFSGNGSSSSDRNLLFGVLAWQSGVIQESQLMDALKSWTFEKNKSLGQILIGQSAIAQSQNDMLELLVDTHLRLRNANSSQVA